MSSNKTPFTRGAEFTQSYLGRANRIVEQAARTDEAGEWGLNGWITMVHNLIDLQIKSSAALLQMAAAGPWWLKPPDLEPPLSEEIVVEPADHPRAIFIAESFARVSNSAATIPDRAITFVPPVLPAGATGFRIDLTNDEYSGATYEGKVTFRPASGSKVNTLEKPISVIVGL